MNKLKIHGWNAKPRTMLRYIKPGDIFLFRLNEERFGVGRVLSKIDLGHVVEFFHEVLEQPVVDSDVVRRAHRVGAPIIIDSYSLFDKKLEGDWRIVAHQENFSPLGNEGTYFAYGAGNSWKKVDIFGNEEPISESEAKKLVPYSPRGDFEVKEMLTSLTK